MTYKYNKIIIHPGFLKTGSTTLQDHFFGPHPEILAIGRPSTQIFFDEMKKPDGYFDRARLDQILQSLSEGQEGKVWVISDEVLSRNYFMRTVIAKRLHDLFPDARIMFTIRNQFDAIASWYATGGHRLRAPGSFLGRHVNLDDFITYYIEQWEFSPMDVNDYSDTIRIYEDIFGKDKIKIFMFEHFINNKNNYIDDICDYVCVDSSIAHETFIEGHSNPRVSVFFMKYAEFRNKFFPGVPLRRYIPFGESLRQGFERYIRRGSPARIVIPEKWRAELKKRYRMGNRRLVEEYDLPLAEYDYPI